MIYLTYYDSPLGMIHIAEEDGRISGLWFEGQKIAASLLKGQESMDEETPVLQKTRYWLDDYFAGRKPSMDLPLQTDGTPFQEEVWQVLQTIPYGQTMTYQEVGEAVMDRSGQTKMSFQAIGQAVGHNPISILIPCHRVLGKDGSLTGYAGGIERKRGLLEIEGAI